MIPMLVGLGASLLGGLFGRGKKKKEEQQREQALQLQRQMQEYVKGIADKNLATADSYRAEGSDAYRKTLDFYESLLGPDSQAALDMLLGPEKSNVNRRYTAAATNLAQTAPRGGGRSATIGNLDFERQGNLFDLLMGKRGEAADKVGTIGMNLAQLGQGYAGLAAQGASGAYGAAAQNTNSLLGIQQANNQPTGLGSGLGLLAGNILDSILNKKKTSSSGGSSASGGASFDWASFLGGLGGGG